MKHKVRNCLATTALSLLLLTIVASFYQADFLCIETVYQSFGANVLIHLGLTLLQKFESNYCIVEILVEIAYTLTILIVFGFLFGWYSSTPLWVLILIGIAVYLIGSLIDVFRIQNEVALINRQLKQRNE